ncbi:MAG: glycosyltransferase [Candidatus Parvarchaeota archaeon]
MDDLVKLGIKPNNIKLIHLGINRDLFYRNKKTEYPSIVYFGGMRPYKRPEEAVYLIDALVKRVDNIHLSIVGDGVEKGKLESIVRMLNLSSHVTFTVRLSDKDLAITVSKAWFNVHTSVTEGRGISIIEAAAAGTPTVAYDVPGVSESVEDGLNGLKVKEGDRSALRNAAIEILKNHLTWSRSSLEVSKKYSWDKAAELWENLIADSVVMRK